MLAMEFASVKRAAVAGFYIIALVNLRFGAEITLWKSGPSTLRYIYNKFYAKMKYFLYIYTYSLCAIQSI